MKINIHKPQNVMPIYPNTIDFNHYQEKISRVNGFDTHQLFIVQSGSGTLLINDKHYSIEKGDMFFLRKCISHEYYGDDSFTTAFLSFDGILCDMLFEFYQLGDFGIYKGKNYRAAEAMLYDLFENFNTLGGYDILSSCTYSMVTTFFNWALKKEIQPIEAVKNYLEANYAKPVTLSDILEFYPYSKAKLCRDFPAKYKMTIFQMLTKIRLTHARGMLKNDPNLKLKNVAEDCGFSDMSYFCKMYKRTYRRTPKS